MLANSFMTAEALGITKAEQRALVRVLGMFERGEISREQYSIGSLSAPSCGTPACIRGWARHVAPGTFQVTEEHPAELRRLFFLLSCEDNRRVSSLPRFDPRNPQQAAVALRNYLTTGEPRWAEALAE
jgi:hypothetical protein